MRGELRVRSSAAACGLVLAILTVFTPMRQVAAGEQQTNPLVSVKYEFNRSGAPITLCPPQGYLRVHLETNPHGNDSLMFFAYSPMTAHDRTIPLCGIGFIDEDLASLAPPRDSTEVATGPDQRTFLRLRPLGETGGQEAEWISFFRLKNQTVRLTTFFPHRNDADKTWAEALHKDWRETLQRQNQEDVIPEIPLWNPAHPAQMSLSVLNDDTRFLIPIPGKTRLIPPGDLWQVGANSPVAILQGPANDLIRISLLDQNYRGRNAAAKTKALRDAKTADFKRRDITILKDLSGREDFTFIISVTRDDAANGGAGGVSYYGYSYLFVGDQAIEIEISSLAPDPSGLETALISWRNNIVSVNR